MSLRQPRIDDIPYQQQQWIDDDDDDTDSLQEVVPKKGGSRKATPQKRQVKAREVSPGGIRSVGVKIE